MGCCAQNSIPSYSIAQGANQKILIKDIHAGTEFKLVVNPNDTVVNVMARI